jgi:hypothetical protein
LVVLEVKGGGIRVNEGLWTSISRNGAVNEIRNPFEQAVASKHTLHRFLSETVPGGDRIPVNHAVVFPDIQVTQPLGLNATPVLVIDSEKLRDVDRAIRGVVAHWKAECNLMNQTLEVIVSRLRPTIEIRRLLRDDVRAARDELIRLTAQQIGVLDRLKRNRRAIVLGGAGTGKTVLAIEKARQFGELGLRTLLTCFNEPLALTSARALESQSQVVVRNFHSLCMAAMREVKISSPNPIPNDWWTDEAANTLADAMGKGASRFDAIVVDEGQDFTEDWITALMLALTNPDDSPFYVFMDSHQDLYVRGCRFPSHWTSYDLSTNCRNTLPIATRVAAIFADTVDSLGAKGPEPVLAYVSSDKELVTRIETLVEKLVTSERIAPHDIVILCASRDVVTQLRTMAVGDHVFCEPGRRGIAVETIWRFKGLETPVAVVALSRLSAGLQESAKGVAYVALSRPNAGLFVLATSEWRPILDGMPT